MRSSYPWEASPASGDNSSTRSHVIPPRLRVVEERHESEIHVQLLMTMEERQPRIVSHEVKFEFLESAQHHHVFDHARRRLAADAR